MKKILITGSSGQLGITLSKIFNSRYKIFPTSSRISKRENHHFLDITNNILLKDVLKIIRPDIIINLAALTNVDLCESNPGFAHAINFQGVKNLVNAFNGPIIHLSTDYVFDGKFGQYRENDITNPINVYGISKCKAEKILLEKSKESLIIRTNVLYDYQSKSKVGFLNWIVDSLKRGEKIKVVDDQFNNPTWTDSLALVIDKAIKINLSGIIHWGDYDYISRLDFAIKIAEIFNLNKSLIKPISTEELNQIAPRPLKGGLNTDLAQKVLKIKPPKINECLQEIIGRIN